MRHLGSQPFARAWELGCWLGPVLHLPHLQIPHLQVQVSYLWVPLPPFARCLACQHQAANHAQRAGGNPQGFPSCMQPRRAVLLLHLILDLHLCFPVSELICKPQSRNKHFNQHSSPSEPATQVKQTDCGIVVNDVDNFNNSKGETDCFPLLLMSLIRSRLDKMICCVFMNLRLAAGKDNNLWIFQLNWRTPYHHPLTHPPNHPSTHPRTAAPSGLIIIIFTPPLSIFR